MLFRKKIQRSCVYCSYGTKLDNGQILCTKKGIRTQEQKCLRFHYDPCKRIPVKARPLDFSTYQDQDYSL